MFALPYLSTVILLAVLLGGGNVLAAASDAEMDQAMAAVEKGDFPAAVKIFEALAKAGDAEAQYNLAMLYRDGKGVAKDPTQSALWFTRAAEQGLADAQYQLGYLYDTGEGLAQNDHEAFVWYRKAAEQGHAGAQINLGVMYANGTGVAQDLKLAYVWFSLASAQGSGVAFENRQVLAEVLTAEEVEELQKLTRQYYQKYVQPFLPPNSNPHYSEPR